MERLSFLLKPLGGLVRFPASGRGIWVFQIGGSRVKAAFAIPRRGSLTVEKILVQDLPEENPAEMLKNFFETTAGVSGEGHPIWCLLARHAVTLRDLALPSADPKELEGMVDLQIGKHTLYPRDQIITAWRVVFETPDHFSHVTLAIAPRANLETYLKIFQELDLAVAKVGLSSDGLAFFVPAGRASETVVIELDSAHTEFQVIARGRAVFSRLIAIGANRLAEPSPVESWSKLLLEIKRSLEIAHSSQVLHQENPPVMLVGAGAPQEILKEKLVREAGIPCELGPRLDEVFTFAEEARSDWEKTSGAVSFYGLLGSLAIPPSHHLDLMPSEMEMRAGFEQRAKDVLQFGFLAGILVMLVLGFFFERMYQRYLVLRSLEGRYRSSAEATASVEKAKALMEPYLKRTGAGSPALQFLEAVHQVTPADIFYSGMDFEEGAGISLKGYARVMASIFDFVSRLNQNERFKNIETKYATKKKIQNQELIEFEITGVFR